MPCEQRGLLTAPFFPFTEWSVIIYMHTHANAYIHMYVYKCVCGVYVCVCVCVCVCVYGGAVTTSRPALVTSWTVVTRLLCPWVSCVAGGYFTDSGTREAYVHVHIGLVT